MAAENRPKGKTKAIIIILAALLLCTLVLAAWVIYLNVTREDNAAVVVPDNLIGTQNTTDTQPGDTSASEPPTESTTPGTEVTEPATEATTPGTEATEATTSGTEATEPSAESGGDTGSNSGSQQQPQEAASLTLHRYQLADNMPFNVTNVLPGDQFVKYYCVKISHSGEITVNFTAEVTQQTKNLASVLEITVTQLDTGVVLYSGPMSGLSEAGYDQDFPASETKETLAYYKIEVYMPTSAGNEYQAAMLEADFRWSVEDDTNMEPPPTGETSNLYLYLVLLIGSCVALSLLLLLSRRKKEEEDGETK